MPLKLREPRPGKTPCFTDRGKYLGVSVEKSLGTAKRSVAVRLLRELEEKIERREYPTPASGPKQPTFVEAAVAYMEAGGERRYIKPLIRHFADKTLNEIDQAAIDAAAVELHPNVAPATRNRRIYTPMSAILHHAGIDVTVKRPKGAKGKVRTDWINPTDAAAIVTAADGFDAEFAELLMFLLYTGCRLGEALALTWEYVAFAHDCNSATAYIAETKNDDPRTVRLRVELAQRLAERRMPSGNVWRFHQGGWLKTLLLNAKLLACGLEPIGRPKKGERRSVPLHRLGFVTFHTFCHTWATWMRRYGHTDVKGLVATGRWRDERSASRYAHVVAAEEWDRVELLPAVPIRKQATGE
jgi:integrase